MRLNLQCSSSHSGLTRVGALGHFCSLDNVLLPEFSHGYGVAWFLSSHSVAFFNIGILWNCLMFQRSPRHSYARPAFFLSKVEKDFSPVENH